MGTSPRPGDKLQATGPAAAGTTTPGRGPSGPDTEREGSNTPRPRKRGALPAIARALEATSSALCLIAGLAYVVVVAVVTTSVVFRYGLERPLTFAPELSGYLVTVAVFIGLGYTFRTGGHIATDILVARLPRRIVTVLEVVAGVVALVWSLAVLVAVSRMAWSYYEIGSTSMGTMQTPLWVPASSMVIGSVFLVLEVLAWMLRIPERRAAHRELIA